MGGFFLACGLFRERIVALVMMFIFRNDRLFRLLIISIIEEFVGRYYSFGEIFWDFCLEEEIGLGDR